MLLGKEPSKFEVYNDIEGELVNFFRIVKNRPAELLLELDLLPLNSREEFTSWLHFHDGGNEPTIHLADQLEIIDRTTSREAENISAEAIGLPGCPAGGCLPDACAQQLLQLRTELRLSAVQCAYSFCADLGDVPAVGKRHYRAAEL